MLTREQFLHGAVKGVMGATIGASGFKALESSELVVPNHVAEGSALVIPAKPSVAERDWIAFHTDALTASPQVTVYGSPNSFTVWHDQVRSDFYGYKSRLTEWAGDFANNMIKAGASTYSAGLCHGEAAKVAVGEENWRMAGEDLIDQNGRVLWPGLTVREIGYINKALTVKHSYDTPEFFHDNDAINLPLVMAEQVRRQDLGLQNSRAIYNAPDAAVSSYFLAGIETNGSTYVNGWRAGEWKARGTNTLGSAWFPRHYRRSSDIPDELKTSYVRYFEQHRPPKDAFDEQFADFLARGLDVLRDTSYVQ